MLITFNINENTIPDCSCEIECRTEWLHSCISLIENSSHVYKLYSRGSDANIVYKKTKWYDYEYKGFPKNVSEWYAQNCDVIDDKIKFIPLGNYPYAEIILKTVVKIEEKCNDIYFNFSSDTSKERSLIVRNQNKHLSHKEYFEEMNKYKYVACPEGYGIDTFRIWEALYLGCIPILKRSNFSKRVAKNYNIIEIDDFNSISIKDLENH